MDAQQQKEFITQQALHLGFTEVGFSKAQFLADDAPRLESWLTAQHHGQMSYMANHFDLRLDPTKLVPGAKTVISLLYNYYPSATLDKSPKVAKYAYGQDYHHVVKAKLKLLLSTIRHKMGAIEGRAFVDSAPVLERSWASRSGLGWVGKNGNLINKHHGSFFFLAELIIDLPLPPDAISTAHCGTCNRCIEACPTQAIIKPTVVDGSKCISYFTIELKEQIPSSYQHQLQDWIFGCDICQDVCPWNKFAMPHQEPLFHPLPSLTNFSHHDWLEITDQVFKSTFKHSPIARAGLRGIRKNLQALGHHFPS
ncbi:MAG: hypothetical protein RIQ89_465 [Bacteroidota bacterium]